MQENIVSNITITPEEVRTFFFSIPVDERPIFSAELEVSQLVVEPEVTEKAKARCYQSIESIFELIL